MIRFFVFIFFTVLEKNQKTIAKFVKWQFSEQQQTQRSFWSVAKFPISVLILVFIPCLSVQRESEVTPVFLCEVVKILCPFKSLVMNSN